MKPLLMLFMACMISAQDITIPVLESVINGDYQYQSEAGDWAAPKSVRIAKVLNGSDVLQPGDPILVICNPKDLRPNYCNGSYYSDGKVNVIFTEAVINNGIALARIYRGVFNEKTSEISGTVVLGVTDHDVADAGYHADPGVKKVVRFTLRKVPTPHQ